MASILEMMTSVHHIQIKPANFGQVQRLQEKSRQKVMFHSIQSLLFYDWNQIKLSM